MEKINYIEAKALLKNKIKQYVTEIKPLKTKEYRRQNNDHGGRYYEVELSNTIRCYHIAYCLLRGRKYQQIEKFCLKKPDWNHINTILQYLQTLEQYKNEQKRQIQQSNDNIITNIS